MTQFLSLLLTTAMLCTLLAGSGRKNAHTDGGCTPSNSEQCVVDSTIH